MSIKRILFISSLFSNYTRLFLWFHLTSNDDNIVTYLLLFLNTNPLLSFLYLIRIILLELAQTRVMGTINFLDSYYDSFY